MPGVFRRRPRFTSRRGLPWLGVAATNTLKDNLVAHWDLDETSGTRVDSHGSYDLTDNGTVGFATGKISNAADFDSAVPEYLTRASHEAALAADGGMQIAGWLNADSVTGTQRLLGQHNAGVTNSSWMLYLSGSTLTFRVVDSGGATTEVSWGSALSAGTWYYVEAYYDPTTSDVIGVCVNRGTDATTSTSGFTAAEGNAAFAMGAAAAGGSAFNGKLDEWAFWSALKSTADRNAAYGSGSGLAYASWIASAAGGAISGSITGSSTVTGALQGKARMSAAVTGSATVTGALNGKARLSGAVTGAATVTASLAGKARLSGTITGSSTVTGDLSDSGSGQMSGSITGSSTVTGVISGKARMSGAITGAATLTGSLSATARMSGSITGSVTVTGVLYDAAGVLSLDGKTRVVAGHSYKVVAGHRWRVVELR